MARPVRTGLEAEQPFVVTAVLRCESLQAMTPPTRSAYPPSLADWEEHKPIIQHLYVREGRNLSEVQRTLCQKYHFKASYGGQLLRSLFSTLLISSRCRSYKNKLRSWGIRKYYRGGTPQSNLPGILFDPDTALVSSFNSDISTGQTQYEDDDRVTISTAGLLRDGFPKLVGFGHESPVLSFIKDQINDAADSIVLAAEAFITSFSDIMTPPPLDPSDTSIKQIKPFRRRKDYIWTQFQHGLNLLEQGEVQNAFADFQRGCAMAEEYLIRPSEYTLVSLLLVMGNRRWNRHRQVWESVLQFMSSMSAKALGNQHPLTHIMSRVVDWNTMRGVAQPCLNAMLDLYRRTRLLGPAHPDVLLLQQTRSVELMRAGEFERSESLIHECCRVSRHVYGASSLATRICLRRLGNLYVEQGRWDDAESAFETILALDSQENSYQGPVHESSIFTCQNLSLVNCRRGDLEKSDYWARQELDLALKIYGPDDEYYVDCVRRRDARLNGEPEQKWFSWLEVS
ncbi:uncharacterized protein A1O5_06208 [Cladophialophora psammophila CBS 110553]|uniref:Clr5 domain-containing protein n=1 Tax=Cladophialophora psammophila CBS 110553 TaxID=1182543 RepID=W9WZN2_9EURO|nr:uncharacterized protein A1O5_06208 [Cladophialophora psammophila CBS 110553]EXJ70141.1 hypothetical protein A1O5_06208 [Cladophialophora psammophila CBS 110553]